MTRIFVSSTIDAPIDEVWRTIRDFNSLPVWHPAIASSYIENGEPSDRVGCIRNFTLKGGESLREKLLAFSDLDYFCTYSILESPLPVRNYVATLHLKPITDGDRTYAEWTATFDSEPAEEEDVIALIGQGVFQAGFDSLKKLFD